MIGRKKELRQIAGRIITGQSTIITDSPRSGKTSVLEYLMAPEKQAELYDDEAKQLIFSYWDACTCTPELTLAQFWQRVLKPLKEYIEAEQSNSQLAKAYHNCKENHFDNYELEKLIAEIKKIDKRLVLIIDEMDALSDSTFSLHSAEFFGGLRLLVSRSRGALVLVITANISRSQLNEKTRNRKTGSLYFNHLEEVVLGALSDTEINELLAQKETSFSENDCDFLKEIAGGHPYLLKVAASVLWKSYEEGEEKESLRRQQQVKQDFYLKVIDTLNAIWALWDEKMRDTFISITLAQFEHLKMMISPKSLNKIIQDTSRYKAHELAELEK